MTRKPGTYAGQNMVRRTQVIVGPNRRGALAWGLFLGILLASGAVRAIPAHRVSALVIELLVLGTPCVFYLRRALKGGALIVIDDRGFTDGRSGRTVEWDEIETVRANTHQGALGLDHSLCLVLKPRLHSQPTKRRFITTNASAEDEIEVSLDGLSSPWEEVVDAVEAKLGRRVINTSNRGFEDVRRSAR